MLRLIKGLQERVARLEAHGGSDDGDVKPAAQGDYTGTSQAKLLEASIVGAVAQPANGSDKAAAPASAQATAGAKQTTVSVKDEQAAQVTLPSQTNADDKTEFPEASDGNPAIFGEFNPGRGFTVGRGEYGELNLSGYMAARYLNQLPGVQTAVDHLGRPITVMPRQDFQIPSGHVVFSRMAVQSQIPIFYVPLDSAGHESGGRRRRPILHLQ